RPVPITNHAHLSREVVDNYMHPRRRWIDSHHLPGQEPPHALLKRPAAMLRVRARRLIDDFDIPGRMQARPRGTIALCDRDALSNPAAYEQADGNRTLHPGVRGPAALRGGLTFLKSAGGTNTPGPGGP